MSGLEIERKFLVKKGDAYKNAAFSSSHIKQGYIPADGVLLVKSNGVVTTAWSLARTTVTRTPSFPGFQLP